jgi:DNA-binding transcriptional LysR family regulator
MDSLSALGVFMRAAESRSFTGAGRQLSISSSAVGKAISRLEDRLSVRLFHRNTRAITLTPEGALFLESCRRIFGEIDKIEQEFARSRESPKGRFKVSLPLVGMLMMPTLQGFMKEFPDIELDMDFTDHLVDVIDGGYDAVVRTGEAADSRLMSRRLGTYHLEGLNRSAGLGAQETRNVIVTRFGENGGTHLSPSRRLQTSVSDESGISARRSLPTPLLI